MTDLGSTRGALVNVRETRSVPCVDIEMRSGSNGTLHFSGRPCVTGVPYDMEDAFGSYTEVVRSGAFSKTLSEGADVGLNLNHQGLFLARTKSGTLKLTEDDKGLFAEASLDASSPLVQTVRSAIDRGDLAAMSFAFKVTRQAWSPDYDHRTILECSLNHGDISLVNHPANSATDGTVALVARQVRHHARPERPQPPVTVNREAEEWLAAQRAYVASGYKDIPPSARALPRPTHPPTLRERIFARRRAESQ